MINNFLKKFYEYKFIFDELYVACGNKFMPGCGSYLFDGQKYEYCDLMLPKQELLFKAVEFKSNILEIGSYMCHSIFIMLLSNQNSKITCIDIDDTYSRPCVEILNKYFNNRVTFIHGNSLDVLQSLLYSNQRFDFFHVDGHHDNNYIMKEFNYILRLRTKKISYLYILFDDQECMVPLQNYIKEHLNVYYSHIPNCAWNNIYYEIYIG